jgi:hypothetical protein
VPPVTPKSRSATIRPGGPCTPPFSQKYPWICRLLLTRDEDLLGLDHEHLTLVLNLIKFASPVIASPREIVRKFFR